MSFLVTGASGLLGANMVLDFLNRGKKVIAVSRRNKVFHPKVHSVLCDLSNAADVKKGLGKLKPECVLHCAAMTDVDGCELREAEAFKANADATRQMARWAKNQGASFVYISTDAVFDGSHGDYKEDDEPRPLSVYGRSKLAGEQAAQEEFPGCLIVRTNIFGWNALAKQSLAEWIIHRLKTKEPVPGFTDVAFNPILVNDLNGVLIEMISDGLSGVHHVAGADSMSKFEFARLTAEVFGLERENIRPSTLAEATLKAKRPPNSTLDIGMVTSELDHDMPTVRSGLRRMKDLEDKGFRAELKKLLGGK